MNHEPSTIGTPRFPFHGYLGLALIAFAELCLVRQGVNPVAAVVSVWTTPICWWGYIFFIDAVIFRLKGNSLIMSRRREFLGQLPLSVVFWLIFEVYNLHLVNWGYRGLPENIFILCLGLGLSFATIMPGMFQTAELLETLGLFQRLRLPPAKTGNRMLYGWVVVGLLFLIVPLLLPREVAKYTFAFVWVGFVLVCDPIAYASGGESLLGDLEKGRLGRITALFVAGYICGLLWEFWNYWAAAKWVYLAPFTQDIRIFEMPLAGFLGFGPFAWEYFCMYQLAKLVSRSGQDAKRGGV